MKKTANLTSSLRKTANSAVNFCILLTLFCCVGYAPNAKGQQKNKYGLTVIGNQKTYLQQVKLNPNCALVPVASYISPLRSNIYYARADNFTHQTLYKNPTLYLNKVAAEKLQLVQKTLAKQGLALLIFDAYRPYHITVKMWQIVPDDRYAANPAGGSGHNRGAAVDLTLVDAQTGQPLAMPTNYDNFSDTAHHSFKDLPESVLANRATLKNAMESAGFKALETEWWHYSLPDAKQYPLFDLSFKQLQKLIK